MKTNTTLTAQGQTTALRCDALLGEMNRHIEKLLQMNAPEILLQCAVNDRHEIIKIPRAPHEWQDSPCDFSKMETRTPRWRTKIREFLSSPNIQVSHTAGK